MKNLNKRFCFLFVFFISVFSCAAFGDGVIKKKGKEVAATPLHSMRMRKGCIDDPKSCATKLFRLISGLNFIKVGANGGFSKSGDPGGSLSVAVVSVDYPVGSFDAGKFDIIFLPNDDSLRVKFTLVDASVLFTCRTESHSLRAPILGQMKYFCTPDSNLGTGGALLDVQWDPATGRFAGRWAQFNLVLNLLGSTNSMAYLKQHLNVSLGIDAESVWHGDNDQREGNPVTGSSHVSRAVLGIHGVLRSDNGHWEGKASLEMKPVLIGTVASFTDLGIVSKAGVTYRFLANHNAVVSAGVGAQAEYWTDPSTSIGTFTSSEERGSVFVGATIGVQYGFSRF